MIKTLLRFFDLHQPRLIYFGCVFFFLMFLSGSVNELTNCSLFSCNPIWHEIIETVSLLVISIGGLAFWQMYKKVYSRNETIEKQLKMASESFYTLAEAQFSDWRLSAAEKEVAIFSLKGLSISEIADIRKTSIGTVKAQCSSIYKKAKVKNRTHLISVLIDEIINFEDRAPNS